MGKQQGLLECMLTKWTQRAEAPFEVNCKVPCRAEPNGARVVRFASIQALSWKANQMDHCGILTVHFAPDHCVRHVAYQ